MGKTLRTNLTLHAQAEDGSFQTYRFRRGEEVPDDLVPSVGNPDVWEGAAEGESTSSSAADADLIGDPLMKRTKEDLIQGAADWGVDLTPGSNKSEIVAAIRAAGYEGDGSDLLDGE